MAVDMFLKIDGIKGESPDAKHKDEVEVLSYTWGISQPQTDRGLGKTVGKANFQDFSITKVLDNSSPQLALYCASGKHIPLITFQLHRAVGDKGGSAPFMEYKFTDVLISSYAPGGAEHGEALPIEQVSFNYAKAEWTYTAFDQTGKAKGANPAKWDIRANKEA